MIPSRKANREENTRLEGWPIEGQGEAKRYLQINVALPAEANESPLVCWLTSPSKAWWIFR